jgi:hypothetical protein
LLSRNFKGSVILTHGLTDTIVTPSQSLNLLGAWSSFNDPSKIEYLTCTGAHSLCRERDIRNFIFERIGPAPIHPSSGHFLIGGWVETSRFRIEFLDDVGYMGDVNYTLGSNSQFKLDIDTVSYSGPAEVLVKDVTDDLLLYDNGALIGSLRNGVISNVTPTYTVTYSGGNVRIVLPSMSPHVIEGITPAESPLIISPAVLLLLEELFEELDDVEEDGVDIDLTVE